MLNGVLSSHNSKNIMAGLTKPATHDIVFIRQESKVQKIEPDDEHDPFLKKSGDDEADVGTTKKHRPPKLMTITNGDNDIEKENDVNTAKELKVNGNVVIYMPPKDGHCHEMIKYRNEDGLETPISFDDGPNFPKTKSNQKCYCYGKRFSKSQTCINIVLALVCTTGVVLGVLSFVKTSGESDKNANFYCYPCEATKSVQEKVKKNGMCCLSDPMKEYKVRNILFMLSEWPRLTNTLYVPTTILNQILVNSKRGHGRHVHCKTSVEQWRTHILVLKVSYEDRVYNAFLNTVLKLCIYRLLPRQRNDIGITCVDSQTSFM